MHALIVVPCRVPLSVNRTERASRILATAVAALLAVAATLKGQVSTIVMLNPGDPGPVLNGIQMIDNSRGWANSDGILWTTANGGATWTSPPIGGVFPASGWGVTSDGGAWGLLHNPLNDPSVEIVRVTTRGGVERRSTPCSPKINCYSAVAAFSLDGQKGILAGIIEGDREHDRTKGYRTTDGGRSWTALAAFPSSINRGDLTIVLTGDSGATMNTGCDFYITSNFGDTWTKGTAAVPAAMCSGTSHPYSIKFSGSLNGWLRTDDGWILQSEDGGASWKVSSLGHQTIFFPKRNDSWISFSDRLAGLIVVQGQLLLTRDGGRTWTTVPSNGERFAGVSCASKRCVVSSDKRISEFTFP
jgi:photosystem II stability/assembly factor-like uncharacterized protein